MNCDVTYDGNARTHLSLIPDEDSVVGAKASPKSTQTGTQGMQNICNPTIIQLQECFGQRRLKLQNTGCYLILNVGGLLGR